MDGSLPAAAADAPRGSGGWLVSQASAQTKAAKSCAEWTRKAMANGLFSARERADMEKLGVEFESPPAGCEKFSELKKSCDELALQRSGNEMTDDVFLEKVAAAKGCASLIPADVCQALKSTARRGIRLTGIWQEFMIGCVRIEIIDKRFEQLRPAM
jgi:hypothetical protein